MKKSILPIFLFLGIWAFSQTGIQFEESNFGQLLEKAKNQNKLLFLDAYASWCGPCKLMEKNIFSLPEIGEYYNQHFVNAKIDMQKGEGIEIAKKYGVKAFPSYLFINGDGEVIHRVVGYTEAEEFIQTAKDAEDPNCNIKALKEKFEKGETSPQFLKKLAIHTLYQDANFSGQVVQKYFETKPNTDFTQEDLQLLLTGLLTSENPKYKIFKSQKKHILKFLPPAQYEVLDTQIKMNDILKKTYNKETKTLDTNYFLSEIEKILGKEQAEKALQKVRLDYSLKNGDYPTYEKLTLEQYKNFSQKSANELNNVAWNFFKKIENKKSLQTAILWAQESVKKNETFANTDTLAQLYYKIGDKKNAQLWAQKSIDLAKKADQDYTETQKILNDEKK
ncbi:thioredoxin fold domain-containing protein [Elizabethkingia argentiflava]|uniref:Thioredoxin fold domain-containing protein n=1 Tax=Elizabethkingia argenteiflava TaxID=2681556 RepID=A0A845PTZ6_9FLAO|nr:thioredoxin fold domain-containing protein [Elizabethkingia argenteiflava]NAW51115.1 thioredoxin fold domain-containing protein [Elizabethkingia argenteiflava]